MKYNSEKIIIIIAIIAVAITSCSLIISYADFVRGTFISFDYKEIQQEPEKELYKPVLAYEDAVTSAVDEAQKSVVSISASKNVPLLEECTQNPFANLPLEIQQMLGDQVNIKAKCNSGKTEKQEIGGGSGFVISEDGLILTNKHVVNDTSAQYTVFTNDGKKFPAKVIAKDPVNDIAVLRVSSTIPVAKLGDSDTLKLGQTAIAIGNALGELRNTVSVGVISGMSRKVTASAAGFGSETIDGVLQTDAAINLGNSGGPLLNLKGEVIGINTAVATNGQNIGFAIPINQAKRAIDSVKKSGSIKVPYLGVRFVMLTEDLVKMQKVSVNEGALVRADNGDVAVMKNSPADKVGIKKGDVITRVNNDKVYDGQLLSRLIQKYNIGDTIELTVVRGTSTLIMKPTLEERSTDK